MISIAPIIRSIAWIFRLTLALAIALGASDVGLAQESDRCYRAGVPEVVVFPDGTELGPGKLRICMDGRLSPVEGLHDVYVDGRVIGRYRSRLGSSEGTAEGIRALFVFVRRGDSRLYFHGYAVAYGGKLRTYRIGTAPAPVNAWRLDAHPADEIVRIAASR